MIFDSNRQIVTKRNISYGAKRFDRFGAKRAVLEPESYLATGLMSKHDVLRNQMERAVLSITSNIAEGFGRQSMQDKKHFYVMARGSAYELQNQLLLSRDTKRITDKELLKLADLSINALRLLHGLIRSTNKDKS